MPVTVEIPTILRPLTAGEARVTASGDTVAAVLAALEADYPGLAERIADESGIRRFVNVYVNDEDVRFLDGIATPVADGDVLTVLPAVAGGSRRVGSARLR